ncbi:hypothetical protein ART_1375 [Arthrobacter sp. PAMC 25486]|nr:hypothetical protein [Arthrobacter sp. PAMC 25486]AIY00974.1 hypothetical protein ART_1375 [Arthrobacter sp. PAMC 25486]
MPCASQGIRHYERRSTFWGVFPNAAALMARYLGTPQHLGKAGTGS